MNRNVTPLSQMMIGQRFDVEFFMYLNSSDIWKIEKNMLLYSSLGTLYHMRIVFSEYTI